MTYTDITTQLNTLRQKMTEYEQEQRQASTEFDKLYTLCQIIETKQRMKQLHNTYTQLYEVR